MLNLQHCEQMKWLMAVVWVGQKSQRQHHFSQCFLEASQMSTDSLSGWSLFCICSGTPLSRRPPEARTVPFNYWQHDLGTHREKRVHQELMGLLLWPIPSSSLWLSWTADGSFLMDFQEYHVKRGCELYISLSSHSGHTWNFKSHRESVSLLFYLPLLCSRHGNKLVLFDVPKWRSAGEDPLSFFPSLTPDFTSLFCLPSYSMRSCGQELCSLGTVSTHPTGPLEPHTAC